MVWARQTYFVDHSSKTNKLRVKKTAALSNKAVFGHLILLIEDTVQAKMAFKFDLCTHATNVLVRLERKVATKYNHLVDRVSEICSSCDLVFDFFILISGRRQTCWIRSVWLYWHASRRSMSIELNRTNPWQTWDDAPLYLSPLDQSPQRACYPRGRHNSQQVWLRMTR